MRETPLAQARTLGRARSLCGSRRRSASAAEPRPRGRLRFPLNPAPTLVPPQSRYASERRSAGSQAGQKRTRRPQLGAAPKVTVGMQPSTACPSFSVRAVCQQLTSVARCPACRSVASDDDRVGRARSVRAPRAQQRRTLAQGRIPMRRSGTARDPTPKSGYPTVSNRPRADGQGRSCPRDVGAAVS